MKSWFVIVILAALLITAGYYFGTICAKLCQTYQLILFPSHELLILLLSFLLAAIAVVVVAGLVAALARPLWVGLLAFLLSGLAMLAAWEIAIVPAVIVHVLAGWAYTAGVARVLDDRIRFSVHSLGKGRGMLMMTLVLIACAALYDGLNTHIRREGFTIPPVYVEMIEEKLEQKIAAQLPAEGRTEALEMFREGFERGFDEFMSRWVEPHEQRIPLFVAAGVFTPLVTITNLLGWVPSLLQSLVIQFLIVASVAKITVDNREVERLVTG